MGWWWKLNQWKIWKTEPTENLHLQLCTFKCRKVIIHECPYINVLSIETSSCLHVETKNRNEVVWWQGNWSNGKFAFGKWNISKWPPFGKYASYRNFSNYQPPQFGSLVFCWFSLSNFPVRSDLPNMYPRFVFNI